MARGKLRRHDRRKGFSLIVTALAIVALITALGLAVDLGRIYIAKSEAQTYVDSAALAASMELDGTVEGILRARATLPTNTNKWNLHTQQFAGATMDFAKEKTGPFEPNPVDPRGYKYVRVEVSVPVPLTFMPMVDLYNTNNGQVSGGPVAMMLMAPTLYVGANSAGGQQLKTHFREGLFPFSPYVHDPNTGPHFGLIPGMRYTLRWAAEPRLHGNNVCTGDAVQSIINLAEAGGGSERGYIESTSSSIIRQAIVYDLQTVFKGIGDAAWMTGGAKQTQRDAIIERVLQDSDAHSETYAEYVLNGTGSGRRIVAVPMNVGNPTYEIKQIGAFFLLRWTEYPQGGNKPFCAEYLGPYMKGSRHKGADENSGYFFSTLVK